LRSAEFRNGQDRCVSFAVQQLFRLLTNSVLVFGLWPVFGLMFFDPSPCLLIVFASLVIPAVVMIAHGQEKKAGGSFSFFLGFEGLFKLFDCWLIAAQAAINHPQSG